jgi:hypothetical protein
VRFLREGRRSVRQSAVPPSPERSDIGPCGTGSRAGGQGWPRGDCGADPEGCERDASNNRERGERPLEAPEGVAPVPTCRAEASHGEGWEARAQVLS